jgi:hypothetical protein
MLGKGIVLEVTPVLSLPTAGSKYFSTHFLTMFGLGFALTKM